MGIRRDKRPTRALERNIWGGRTSEWRERRRGDVKGGWEVGCSRHRRGRSGDEGGAFARAVIAPLAGTDGGLRKGAGNEAVERWAERGQKAVKGLEEARHGGKGHFCGQGQTPLCLWRQPCLVVTRAQVHQLRCRGEKNDGFFCSGSSLS